MADHIDREELQTMIKEMKQDGYDEYMFGSNYTVLDAVKNAVKKLPSVDAVKQKHGHWELKRRIADVNWWSCSICGRISEKGRGLKNAPYCQYCGAKMDEVTE